MRQKNLYAILFVAIMAVSYTSCGKTQNTSGMETVESVKEQTQESTAEEVLYPENENAYDGIVKFKTTANIEETVLVDENNVRITATGLNYTDYSVELNLIIENNSDEDLSFISGSVGYSCNAINGYMVDAGYLNVDVAAGKKANESIDFSLDELAIYGITEVADFQMGFDVKNDDYTSIYSGCGRVKTTAADTYDYVTDTYNKSINSNAFQKAYGCVIDFFAEDELYNDNGVRLVSEALMTNKDGEKIILLEIVNDSPELVYVVTKDISINELVVYSSTWSSDSINPGTRRIIGLQLSSMFDLAYWDIFGISNINDFTFSFSVNDLDDTEIAAPQEINITISEGTSSIDDTGMELYNENGIRIISKGLFDDSVEFSDDMHMLFLIQNNTSDVISIEDAYDSLSINGFMTDYIAYSRDISPGNYAVMDVEIMGRSLEENNIISIDDITDAEMTFEIKDDSYKTVAEPAVSINY